MRTERERSLKVTRRLFKLAEGEEGKPMGFVPLGKDGKPEPMADPVGGLGVAHDLTEHMNKFDMTPQGELMAFGAILFLRWEHQRQEIEKRKHLKYMVGLGGVLTTDKMRFSEWIDHDAFEVLQHVLGDQEESPTPLPEVKPMVFYEASEESVWAEIIELHSRVLTLCESEGLYERMPDLDRETVAKEVGKFNDWIVKGHRQAVKYYEYCIDTQSVYEQVFKPIEQFVNEFLSYHNQYEDWLYLMVEFDDRLNCQAVLYNSYHIREMANGDMREIYHNPKLAWRSEKCIVERLFLKGL